MSDESEEVIVMVELRAFARWEGPPERKVRIPRAEWNSASDSGRRGLAFMYGQNDFQSDPDCYSVSMGDVIRMPDGRRFRVEGIGFSELP